MKKLDPVVRKESGFIALSSLICAALVQAAFLLFEKWDFSVALGGIIGWVLSAGNFFLMSVGVQSAVECADENQAQLKMRTSYTWRMVVILAVMVISFVVDAIHWVPVVASIFYPRVIITIRQLWQRYVRKMPEEEPAAAGAPAVPAEDDTDEEDGFEKALGHFARKIPTDYAAAAQTAEKKKQQDEEEKNADGHRD